jgi:ubiquinone/menaquinone biosynthesis C-methylase UbiE
MWFAARNIPVSLSVCKAEDLSSFSDKSIDVIFTDALFIYIGPDKIEKVIKEFIRVAKKVMIFNEWHSEGLTPIYNDHWIYNYEKMFVKFVSKNSIQITKIPAELWGGDWTEYGHIIEVKL